mmetsp:Transcript_82891/g.173556  ORF Transcript_82891/g.173556 Transcript_82891/m.173556 type:complete len:586 (-) Transcript_82891:11-1768(-)
MGQSLRRELCVDAGETEPTAADLASSAPRLPRPFLAEGTFLRILMVNDVYKLDHYPRLRTAYLEMKTAAKHQDCVFISMLPGDFLSPCTLSSLDGGVAMLKAVNEVGIEYVMYGNHEFDFKSDQLQARVREYEGTWINSNVTEPKLVDRYGNPLPEYELLKVGTRTVALTAFLLDDMNQFSPLNLPTIAPPAEALSTVWDKIQKETGGKVDAFVPMTHLNIKEDRLFAERIKAHDGVKNITPVLLGGHDHEVYIEEAGNSLVFKVGCDAENFGVIDLWWDPSGKLQRSVHMFSAQDFSLDPAVQAFAEKKAESLKQLSAASIFELPSDGSQWGSTRVRFENEPLVSHMLQLTKEAMPGVDIVLIQGGGVRGNSTYQPGPFTYGDLMKEFAFDTQIAIVDLPGDVLEKSISNSRTKPEGSKPFFLHTDMDAVLTGSNELKLVRLNGQDFDPKKTYKVATYQFILGAGMGNIQPMLDYVKEKGTCPALEDCLGIKHYIMQSCMKRAWHHILGLKPNDSLAEVTKRAQEMFKVMDHNGDGYIEPDELDQFLATRGNETERSLVKFLVDALDHNGDGNIEMDELCSVAN